jgi:multidrug efflux pump subunit AcrA (membrane-fusion protein)
MTAEVRLKIDGLPVTWEARIDRISDSIDPQTRSVGVIVAVDEPYRQATPGVRPPLVKNMYVEVELRAPLRREKIVVPRVAVHRTPDGDRVYIADAEDRLAVHPVTLGVLQSDFVVIEMGLAGGERIVVSDLIPAIEGMLLAPREDAALADRLRREASGATTVK